MIGTLIERAWFRFRPAEGWLPVFLLAAIVSTLASAVVTVKWVPEGEIVMATALSGLFLSVVLAKRPMGWLVSWLFLISYGLVLTTSLLGQLWPPLWIMSSGWQPSSAHIRQNWGLFVDRAGGWLEAVFGGGSSEETIVFAFGLGFLAWLLSAYAGWSTFRQHRPLTGLTMMGFALAVNGYYGDAPVWLPAIFVGLVTLLVALVHYADLEQLWERKGVDYSGEIRLDLLMAGGGISLGLLAFSYALPTLNLRAISRAFLDRPAVHQAEETLERAFAGVRQPSQGPLGRGAGSGAVRGNLPRAFLLGDPPERQEVVVMTATVEGNWIPPTHWRGPSYDVYTGRGWAVSHERQEVIPADQTLPLPPIQASSTLTQSVHWLERETDTRYTLGLPLQFEQETVAFWRGIEDLSRVHGSEVSYKSISRISLARPAELRQAGLFNVPPAILARYTQLPESVPQRVLELAQEARGNSEASPYDQAKAIERFLHQYPYSLEVNLPPPGTDPVDYFLFDLQTGYCDYYASAMVILARSLGLPARLATGFLAQQPDDNGVQTIRRINAHSWAEIYFAGYGWIEFEPTAGFPSERADTVVFFPDSFVRETPFPESPAPIPERDPQPPSIWWLSLVALIPLGWWLRRRHERRRAGPDRVQRVYGRLLQSGRGLGQLTPANQTPAEFEAALLTHLQRLEGQTLSAKLGLPHLYPDIRRITASFMDRQYSKKPTPHEPVVGSWRRIRGRLWLLVQIGRLRRFVD